MDIPVIRMTQQGRALYLGRMMAGQLLEVCEIHEWDPAKGWDLSVQGYQRAPDRQHSVSIGRFLADDPNPFLPTAALLSAREQEYGIIPFSALAAFDDIEFGTLSLSAGRRLLIVDFQHRWRGFRYAVEELRRPELKTYAIPVVVMADIPAFEEMEQFYLINNKQKRIDTDLALTLMQTMAQLYDRPLLLNLVGPRKAYLIDATRLTFKVAAGQQGPWAGKITLPHEPKGTRAVSIKSFAESIRPLVSLRSPLRGMTDDQIVDALTAFWTAIEQLVPVAFQNPLQYSVQRTIGVFSLHMLAAKRVFHLCKARRDFGAGQVHSILSEAGEFKDELTGRTLPYFSPDFWAVRGPVSQFPGSGGGRALANLILANLPSR